VDYEIENDEHNQMFVVLHNRVARDRTLTRSARGLLAELLSYRAGTISFDTLLRNGSEKRTALRRMLRELETAGYITRSKRRGERGRWENKMVVRETPTRGENQPLVPPAETHKTAGRVQGRFSTGGQSTGGEPDDKNEKTEDLEVPKEEKTKISLSAREETLAEMLAAAVPAATEREIDLCLSWIEDLKTQGKIQSPRPWVRALVANGDAPALVADSQNRSEAGTDAQFARQMQRAQARESAADQACANAQSVKGAFGLTSAMCRIDDHEHCHLDWCKCPCGHRLLHRYTSPYAA